MNLDRVTSLKASDGHSIPALSVSPASPRRGAVLHPYGCSKEHMLGLALGLAGKGIASLAIDLCGHGENMSAIGPGVYHAQRESRSPSPARLCCGWV